MFPTRGESSNQQNEALWLNLVPRGEDSRGLLIASDAVEGSIHAQVPEHWLSFSLSGRTACEARSRAAEILNSLKALPCGSQDCIVVDDRVLLRSGFSEHERMDLIHIIRRVLSANGCALFLLPPGLRFTFDRVRAVRMLKRYQPGNLDWYLCDDQGPENASRMVTFSRNRAWAINQVAPRLVRPRHNVPAVQRRLAKRAAIKFLGLLYPYYQFLVVFAKVGPDDQSRTCSVVESVFRALRRTISDGPPLNLLLLAHPLRGSELIFAYDSRFLNLMAVATSCRNDSPNFEAFKRKHDNLRLMSEVVNQCNHPSISTPLILHIERNESRTVFITSSAQGRAFSDFIRECSNVPDPSRLRWLMRESLEFLLDLQSLLSERLDFNINHYDERYQDNYLDLRAASEGAVQPEPAGLTWVQHGDLSSDNVFFSEGLKRWSVIDWEWFGSGYPPLFDLFTFLQSAGAALGSLGEGDWREEFLRSAVRTFFSQSPLSELFGGLLRDYSDRMKLNSKRTFALFCQFLLWRCNRYRLDRGAHPDAIKVWEKLLHYALEHEHEFICN